MEIGEQGNYGKRMKWVPDPPLESWFTDMGIFLYPLIIYICRSFFPTRLPLSK